MKKILIIACLCLTAGSINGQVARPGTPATRVPVPLATAEVNSPGANTLSVNGNASVNSVQVNAVAPEMATRRNVPVPRATPNHTIQVPVQAKDAPKHLRAIKKDSVK